MRTNAGSTSVRPLGPDDRLDPDSAETLEDARGATAENSREGVGFSTGHRVLLVIGEEGEEVQVRSPSGAVQVRIVLSDSGPVVELRQARIELTAVQDLRARCRRLELEASEGVCIHSGGDVEIAAAGETHLSASRELTARADLIRIN